jgi:multidrug transporter EmrE-like cation transporter
VWFSFVLLKRAPRWVQLTVGIAYTIFAPVAIVFIGWIVLIILMFALSDGSSLFPSG